MTVSRFGGGEFIVDKRKIPEWTGPCGEAERGKKKNERGTRYGSQEDKNEQVTKMSGL